jgi:capsular polysaccharide biosynthesis protein
MEFLDMNESTKEKEISAERKLQELLAGYLRKWKTIVVCVLLGAVVALCVSFFFITPTYQTSITIYVNNNRVAEDQEHFASSDLSASIYLVKAYMILVTNDTVLSRAATELNEEYSVEQLREAISTAQYEDTVMFTLSVTHTDPKEATRIANVMGKVIPEVAPTLIEASSAKALSTAKVPTSPFSPDYQKNALLGGVIGLALALVYITIMHLRDTRIKDENDLTEMFQIPILGRIPDMDGETATDGYGRSRQTETKEG